MGMTPELLPCLFPQCGAAGCMMELAQQLAVIMIGKQMINNILEWLTPWVTSCASWRNSSDVVIISSSKFPFSSCRQSSSKHPVDLRVPCFLLRLWQGAYCWSTNILNVTPPSYINLATRDGVLLVTRVISLHFFQAVEEMVGRASSTQAAQSSKWGAPRSCRGRRDGRIGNLGSEHRWWIAQRATTVGAGLHFGGGRGSVWRIPGDGWVSVSYRQPSVHAVANEGKNVSDSLSSYFLQLFLLWPICLSSDCMAFRECSVEFDVGEQM